MKQKNKNYWLLGFLLLFYSCGVSDMPDEELSPSTATDNREVTFKASATDDVTLFIFRKTGDKFLYQTKIASGWNAQGKIVREMVPGTYRFLFVKSPLAETHLSPDPLTPQVTVEDLRFEAAPVAGDEKTVSPVDELFLPKDASTADPRDIKGGETVSCLLTRAVCQVHLSIKRGILHNKEYTPIPYPEGESILDKIKTVRLQLTGVGRSVDLTKSYGEGILSTSWSASEKDTLTAEGFAVFNSPFFFPPSSPDKKVEAVVVIQTEGGELTSPTMTVESVERNSKIDVVVWLKGTLPEGQILIGITADIQPITDSMDGDVGFWE